MRARGGDRPTDDGPAGPARDDRFTMFPIKYPAVWEMYKKAEASFWTGACARRARGDERVVRDVSSSVHV